MIPRFSVYVVLTIALLLAVWPANPLSSAAPSISGCVFSSAPQPDSAAFCDTFNQPAGTGNRSGDLDGTQWGVSRATGATAVGSLNNLWAPVTDSRCGATQTVRPEHDVTICNGEAVETVNDGGTVTTLAMYPKQPFDIAGRVGTVSFDVSNNSQGSHAAWPEFWYTDLPVPAPFTHETSWQAVPQNGFGVRFAGCTDSNGKEATCSGGTNAVGVDSAITVNNYVPNDSFNGGNLKVIGSGSVTKSQVGQHNHYELRVSQSQIDVYGTNAFSGTLDLAATPLVHIASIINANLSLTRGLIWIEDAHYNARKACLNVPNCLDQRVNTFTWDNVGFDGPVVASDLTFDVPDCVCGSGRTLDGVDGINLGWAMPVTGTLTLHTTSMTAANIAAASKALLTFNYFGTQPLTIRYSLNGNLAHTLAWPFPDNNPGMRTIGVQVPAIELQPGPNTVSFSADSPAILANVDLVLAGAGGIPGVTATPTATVPGATATVPAMTATPIAGSCVVTPYGCLQKGVYSRTTLLTASNGAVVWLGKATPYVVK